MQQLFASDSLVAARSTRMMKATGSDHTLGCCTEFVTLYCASPRGAALKDIREHRINGCAGVLK